MHNFVFWGQIAHYRTETNGLFLTNFSYVTFYLSHDIVVVCILGKF